MLKTSNAHCSDGKKHESMFFTIGFCVGQILRIAGFQIETNKNIFISWNPY
jgi:hypothetical protein